jgi:hypothetical protein
MLKKFKQWLRFSKLGNEFEPVEAIVVYCNKAGNYTMCFRKKDTPINFKCPLCGSYVPNGEHRGCVLV